MNKFDDKKPRRPRDGDRPFKRGGSRDDARSFGAKGKRDEKRPFKSRDGDRDDARKPRFSRDDDRKPRFGRDDDRKPRPGRDDDRKPRFNRDDDRKPRFGRDDDRKPRGGGDRDNRRNDDRNDTRRDHPGRDDARPSKPPVKIDVPGLDARRGALEVIERVRGGEAMDDALKRSRAFTLLEGADRGFARAMASAVLRRRGSLDHLIGAYIDRPLPKKAVRVMDILRLAAAQSLILKTPDHATVSTAVALAGERQEIAHYAKLINAVARKIAGQGEDALDKLPARTDVPGWMWRGWERNFGPVKARAIALAHRVEAPLDLTVKDAAARDEWATRLGAELLPNGTLRLAGVSDVTTLEGFAEGAWWVQDAAASLPVALLGDVAGKSVLDICAAPGGKTMQLAAAGAHVTAVDISAPRLERVQENLERTGLKAKLIEADVMKWTPDQKVDAILLDAPCTATGTIRRHPDLPWLKNEDDAKALGELQGRMIERALTFLKPEGVLVYSVCSLQPEEGERQVKAVLSGANAPVRRMISAEEIGGLSDAITRNGDLRTLPSMLGEKGGMDGFFAARFALKD